MLLLYSYHETRPMANVYTHLFCVAVKRMTLALLFLSNGEAMGLARNTALLYCVFGTI
jgi:hypothetical protein